MANESWNSQVLFGPENERASAEEMDEKRLQNVAYQYLCHLEEAKVWIESCIAEELPQTTELEEYLRNGVCLAKLAHFFAPQVIPLKKVYDINLTRYKNHGLHFRHTDNINHWLAAMQKVGLPESLLPETTDVYDKKNMPRVVYCLHALSLFLHKHGLAPKIQDLYGKVKFTDEEISAVRVELEKYGIQMPSFSTIDGILANEMPVDDAAMHAAVIAINKAIDKEDASELLTVLQNPASLLTNIHPSIIDQYQKYLSSSKLEKATNTQNKSSKADGNDVYDEMLTRAEIQNCLESINKKEALNAIKKAVESEDVALLLKVLVGPTVDLKNILPKNNKMYMTELLKLLVDEKENNNDVFTWDNVQEVVRAVNEIRHRLESKEFAIKEINRALDNESMEDFIRALQSSEVQLPPLLDYATGLYFVEFSNIRQDNEVDLKYEELNGGIIVLSAVALVNKYIEMDDPDVLFNALTDVNAHISGLDPELKDRYHTKLAKAKRYKSKNDPICSLLTHVEVQECIILVNNQAEKEHDQILAIHKINDVLNIDQPDLTFEALCDPHASIQNIDDDNSVLYHYMLKRERHLKAGEIDEMDEETSLWIDEIQYAVDKANKISMIAAKCCEGVAVINNSIDVLDVETFQEHMQDPNVQLIGVISDCIPTYMHALSALKRKKVDNDCVDNDWLIHSFRDDICLNYNIKTRQMFWTLGNLPSSSSTCLTKDEIQMTVSAVTSDYDRQLLYQMMTPHIIILQAFIRGFLLRRAYKMRLEYLNRQTDSALTIQAWWRGCRQRKLFHERLHFMKSHTPSIIKVQSAVRRHLAVKKYKARLKYFKDNVKSVIKIQSCWRASKTRKAFQELRNSDNPSFGAVRMFVHLLDVNNLDFNEELELHQLKGDVIKSIRHNQQLEKDLAVMDLKIGLLVKNRITLQDVMVHGTTLDKKRKEGKESSSGSLGQLGLKSLSKGNRQKMDAYQHLFYLIQTEPRYLSRLIFLMLPSKMSKFVESIIQAVYNFASNEREEYLLLKLFKTALQEEISCKVDNPNDIITGNPLIIKMIVGFNRNKRGQSSLREILGPLVKQVLENKNLRINTNPVDIYKTWVNQLESQTGQRSGLPYNVTAKEAIQHVEVQNQLQESLKNLKEMTLIFFNTIVNSLDKLSYGILYMAKVLKLSLEAKFPSIPEKDLLKIVGNLIYYRYINSAIVAPDAFDIVDVGATQSLSNEQRRNLASVAKILQFATSKTGFGEENCHLADLNPFIIECHEKFKVFFKSACEVEELEAHFKVDEYTEATLMAKPVIYISLQDICELHQLLLEHENVLAPDPDDPLHELLEDLGKKPSVESLIGEGVDELTVAQLAKTEVFLSLSSKFEVPESPKNDLYKIFVRTKHMIVDAMRCLEVAGIPEMLNCKIEDTQQSKYVELTEKRRAQHSSDETDRRRILQRMASDYDMCTLEEVVDKIRHNLNILELEGFVSSKNSYQDIINKIALDIRNRHRYRVRRKQDLAHHKATLTNLQTKTSFYEEQVDYYNKYIQQCRDSMSSIRKKPSRRSNANEAKLKSKVCLKYTAAKLHEKGIIQSMEGLTANQYKNVLFEISPTEVAGNFLIKIKYMGTSLSDVVLDIQELLDLQYEGVSVQRMFDRAEINVNLLLYLLNSKFYGKSK